MTTFDVRMDALPQMAEELVWYEGSRLAIDRATGYAIVHANVVIDDPAVEQARKYMSPYNEGKDVDVYAVVWDGEAFNAAIQNGERPALPEDSPLLAMKHRGLVGQAAIIGAEGDPTAAAHLRNFASAIAKVKKFGITFGPSFYK